MPTIMVDSKGKDVVAAGDQIEIKTKHGVFEASVEGIMCSDTKFVFGENLEIIPFNGTENENDQGHDINKEGDYLLLRVNTTKKK